MGAEDPFLETIKILDFLQKGAIKEMDPAAMNDHGINFEDLIAERRKGIPLEYVMGKAYFMGHPFFVNNETLIPTPETRLLVETVEKIVEERESDGEDIRIIDMGTGCGNIAVSIGLCTENTRIYASDISEGAVRIAGMNVEMHGLTERIEVSCGDRFEPFEKGDLKGNIDIIVCNPPYLPTESIDRMDPEIRDHEPHLALDAGPFGVDFFVHLLEGSLKYLKPKGVLLFEFGERQENIVKRLIRKSGGYGEVRFHEWDSVPRMVSLVKE